MLVKFEQNGMVHAAQNSELLTKKQNKNQTNKQKTLILIKALPLL